MTPEEKLQSLLHLKRHEQPPEGYFDDFLKEFQTRQRRDLMKRSILSQIADRVAEFFSAMTRPQVLVPAAACYMVGMLLLLTWPHKPKPTISTNMSIVLSSPNVQPRPTFQPQQQQPTGPDAGGSNLNGQSQLVGLPPAPQQALFQPVSAADPAQSSKRPRSTSQEALKKLVGEPLPEEPQPWPQAKLREL